MKLTNVVNKTMSRKRRLQKVIEMTLKMALIKRR